MNNYLILTLVVLLAGCGTMRKDAHPVNIDFSQSPSQLLSDRGLARDYSVYAGFAPVFLRGDFDGDSKTDIALMINNKVSKKIGIVIMTASEKNYILGAGHVFGNGGDDFTWMDHWKIQKKSERVARGFGEGNPPILKGDAIYAEKTESASCIIYYDGSDFKWYQQAD